MSSWLLYVEAEPTIAKILLSLVKETCPAMLYGRFVTTPNPFNGSAATTPRGKNTTPPNSRRKKDKNQTNLLQNTSYSVNPLMARCQCLKW